MAYSNFILARWLSIWLVLMSLWACSSDDDSAGAQPEAFRRTVVVYMAAQNSLGYLHGAANDSTEIAQGAQYLADNDHVILFIDDARAPRIYRFWQKNGRVRVDRVYQYPTDVDSTDPSTLDDVLTRVSHLYPSQSYGLVLWSHGTSWLQNGSNAFTPLFASASRGFGVDVGPGGNMANDRTADGTPPGNMFIDDMAAAIEDSGIHFDFIVFDACLMQCVEVAYDLRHVADYIVGSPATTPFEGLYYVDQLRDGLFAYPTNDENICRIVDTHYFDVVHNPTTQPDYQMAGTVMSVVRTAGLDSLASATARVLPTILAHQRAVSHLSDLMTGYVDFSTFAYPDMYDVSSVMSHLLPDNDYQVWRRALDQCVIYQKASPEYYFGNTFHGKPVMKPVPDNYCGVSMYFPQNKYAISGYLSYFDGMYRGLSWYADVWPHSATNPDEYPTAPAQN